ncbi:MAG: serine acetyltransferase [Burkholderiales bacterium PBB5]|nr:MAG: serine acetyltransferase [Burkholderiales bacterium PBB5]
MLRIHRLAHWLHVRGVPLLPRVLYGVNRILFAVVLPPSVKVGRDVVLGYSGLGVVIHARCVIGDRVLIGTGVTIGGRGTLREVPVIGDDVEIGSGAKILGPIHIGKGAAIGANAVVLTDVPDHAVAVGVPARIVRRPAGKIAEL